MLAELLWTAPLGQHQPLNRQSQRFKCKGVDLSVSTVADQVGARAFAVSRCHDSGAGGTGMNHETKYHPGSCWDTGKGRITSRKESFRSLTVN
jgi:hypothetical protein